ncbi:TRAP transporter substrate-binding protein DctP [Chloroflexota bacterium]
MKKKILLIPLALVLIASLIACAAPAPAPAPTTTVTAPAPAPTTTTVTAPAPAPTTTTVTAPAPDKRSYHWKYSGLRSPEHFISLEIEAFVDRIAELSDGRIQIDYHPANVLGDWVTVFGEVMRGTIEMQMTSYNTVHDPRLNVVWIPYGVTNWEEADSVYSPGGFIWEKSYDMNRALGVETLAAIPSGFIGMGASKLPPSPGDPDVNKGMKIRVWGAIPPEKLMERFGYLPTVMPWSEVFSALQMGVIEAAYGPSVISAYDNIRDVISYWLPYRGNYESHISIMNAELFDSLSYEDQDIIMTASSEWRAVRSAAAEAQEQEYIQKMTDYGVEVVEFTQAEYDNFRVIAAADVWPALEPIIGKALLDEALAAIGGG